jgi:NADPH2:quinone reductase
MAGMRQVAIVRHGSPDSGLALENRPTPAPGPGQVLIAVEAAGVNFSDILSRRGLNPEAPPLPYVPGYEAAGHVAAAGIGVTQFKTGDPVVALLLRGGYADTIVAGEDSVFPRPLGMDSETASALPVQALTAWYALYETGTVRPGDRVLIHAAAGGVGGLAVQMALNSGAVIFGTAGSKEKIEHLRKAGVQHPIDYRSHDYESEVRRLTNGEGIDIVLDSLGGGHIAKGMRLLRTGGRLASFGYAAQTSSRFGMFLGFATMKLLNSAFLLRDCHGIFGINMLKLAADARRIRFRIEDVFDLWGEGALKPHIGARFPLEEAARAHEAVENRSVTGKVILTM